MINFVSENKFKKNVKNTIKNRNCFQQILYPYTFGYISTLGVIDEFRKIGLGKILVKKAMEIVQMKKNCLAVYLHVVEYNKSAIKFYEKLDFIESEFIQDYYTIKDAKYNARVYYKILKNNSEMFNLTELVDDYHKIKSQNDLLTSDTNDDIEKINSTNFNKISKTKRNCFKFISDTINKIKLFNFILNSR